jgi:diguanylate cyclase
VGNGAVALKAICAPFARLSMPLFRKVPPEISDELLLLQFAHLRSLIPVLYIAIALIVFLAGLAARGDFPIVYQLAFPGLMISASAIRFFVWRGRRNKIIPLPQIQKHLRNTLFTTVTLSLIAAFWCTASYFESDETRRILAPLFMTMGAFACANCLASVPRIAIAALLFGLTPPLLAMAIANDLGIQALALSIIVVSLLQVRLVLSKFQDTVNGLLLQSEMRTLADTDALTGLHNRRAFTGLLERQIEGAPAELALAMLDLDGFKAANDRFGHAAGDAVLVEVARRLKAMCGSAQSVARIGGDEFAILFEAEVAEKLVQERVAALRTILSLPYHFQDHMIRISASIGTAHMPADGHSVSALMLAADHILYQQKARQRAA